jgi:serine/threonine protein kinase
MSSGGFGSSKKKKKEAKQRWLKKLEVARDIARAVRLLHEKRVVYRDLKPSYIGFAYDGTSTIFDFGLAKTLNSKDELCNSMYRMTGHTGSLRNMAPEVAQDLPYNNLVDSYSFDMLLWQLCTHMPPYLGFTREKHKE